MEWKLTEEKKTQYDNMLRSAQDIELNIGSGEYRIHKLLAMREEIDKTLKSWWEETIKELNLDPNNDYMISREGMIKDVSKKPEAVKAPPSAVGTNATTLQ